MVSKQTIISSLIWKFLERIGTQLAQFVVSIVLARLLAPNDFGIIALVMIVIAIADVFVHSGLNTALIQKKDADELDFSSVFYASMGVATIIYTGIFFTSPFIAEFYGKTELVPVIRVLSLTLFLGVFNSIQGAYISKHMLFKKLFLRSIGAMIPSGILGIALAFCGFGVWALVAQQLSNVFLAVIIMWFTIPWRPRLQFSFTRLQGLFSFGWKLLLSSLLDTLYSKMRGLIIGKIFTPADLAFYDRGDRFPFLAVNNINNSIQSVMLPSISAIQDDKSQVKRLMRRAIVTSSFLIMPIMAGLAATAKPVTLILLGEKWLPCVPFMQIYCFIYCFYPIHTSNLSAINAMGRSDIFLKLEIIKKILGVSLILASLYIFRSPIGIAYGTLCNTLCCAFINAHPNKKLLNYGYLEQIRDILPSFILAILMGIIIHFIEFAGFNLYLTLVLQILIGFAIYMGTAKQLHLECLEYLIETVKGFKYGR